MKVMCIYMISSIRKPERQYIGSAVNFKARKSGHITRLKKGYHHSKQMQRHVGKYGINDLKFEVIQKVHRKELLLTAEQSFIDMFNPYFNSCPTAGSNLGRKFGPMPEAHKRKISDGNKGRVVSEATRELQRVKMFKYSLDGELLKTYKSGVHAIQEEGIRARSANSKNLTVGGYVWVSANNPLPDFDEIKRRLKDAKKVLCKPVLQIDKSGKMIAEYEGVRIAWKETGIDHRSIAAVAAGKPKRKSAGGYVWKYKEVDHVT